jgi:hypothetical protein
LVAAAERWLRTTGVVFPEERAEDVRWRGDPAKDVIDLDGEASEVSESEEVEDEAPAGLGPG